MPCSLQKEKVGSQVHLGQSLRQKKRVHCSQELLGCQGPLRARREELLCFNTFFVPRELSSTEH